MLHDLIPLHEKLRGEIFAAFFILEPIGSNFYIWGNRRDDWNRQPKPHFCRFNRLRSRHVSVVDFIDI